LNFNEENNISLLILLILKTSFTVTAQNSPAILKSCLKQVGLKRKTFKPMCVI